MNEDAVVVAAGCYVQTATEKLLEDLSVDILIGNNKNEHVIFTNLISIYRQGLLFNANRNRPAFGALSRATVQQALFKRQLPRLHR